MNPLPPLNPLKVFEAAGRLLSVSKAADELAVTPAAVSRQIRALEAFVGVQLFHRVHGGLELTTAGSRYLADLLPLFAGLREATNVVMGGGYRRRILKIRSPATFAVRWLIPRLASFHRRHPSIDVRLNTSAAPLNFDREDIDGGIQLGDGSWPRQRLQALVPNVLVPVLSRHRIALAPVKQLDQLSGETLLHSLARPDDWALWLRAAGVADLNPYRGMKYETSLLAYQAAIEGHGIAIAQRALVARELTEGQLIEPFAFALDRGSHTYYFSSPMNKPESNALRDFKEWLVSAVDEGTNGPDGVNKS